MKLGLMRSVLLLMLVMVAACEKPVTSVEGTWANEKTASTIEFKADKTGVIHQRTQPNVPADLPFMWNMINDKEFEVVVAVPGAPAPARARGRLEKNRLILENDSFKKVK